MDGLTLQQAAERTGASWQALRKAVYRQQLPAEKFGPQWVVTEAAVRAWLANPTRRPGRPRKERE